MLAASSSAVRKLPLPRPAARRSARRAQIFQKAEARAAAAAAALASAFWKICARRAERLAAGRGSGSFRTALLDAANTLTASDAAREAEILAL